MYPSQTSTPTPSPALCRSPLEKPSGVRVEVLNPIEKCYFNADARPLRQQQQEERGGGWSRARVSSLKIGSRSITPRMEQEAGNVPARRTHAPAIAGRASFCMQLNTTDRG